MKVQGYAALKPKDKLAPFHFERRDMRIDDVVVEILYCGICHSDVHHVNNDWGRAIYPIVPGHEIVGQVSAVGSSVESFKIGDIVGVGCMVDSCQTCAQCQQGLEQYCENGNILTYNSVDKKDQMRTFGGYSDTIVVNKNFVLKIPSNLDIKAVAPLLCAGITTYSPLKHWNVKEGTRVAVIGIGGLGHMAVKLAKAMKANVSVFTRSQSRVDYLKQLGADEVIVSSDPNAFESVKNQFDLILDTVPYEHDLNPYVSTLKVNGTLVVLGFIGNLENLSTIPLIMQRKAVAGSVIGGIKETQEMLDFCGQHNIVPDIELINIQDVNEAYDKMLSSSYKANSRFVIDMASLKKDFDK